nr:MAG TPA: hypothetical protein [Caudoviricetes sp.]
MYTWVQGVRQFLCNPEPHLYWCGNNAWAAAALCFGLKDRSGASLANSS